MDKKLFSIASSFALKGKATEIKSLGEGLINDSYSVCVDGRQRPSYILQRKNVAVFPDVPAMMNNIKLVTEHIKKKVADPLRETLTIVPALDGKLYHEENGDYWAVCVYIDGSLSLEKADTTETAFQGGLGLGRFHRLVSDFKEPLAEVIKGFHNIRWRFRQWDETIAKDPVGRACQVAREIQAIESRRPQMLEFWSRYEAGEIPTRVTHNDAKIANFLFNEEDRSLLCAIDLDTLMSSTLLNDVGDALRTYPNTADENEADLDKVSFSMDMFTAYMKGYLSEMAPVLSPEEIKYLAFSGIYITCEQALRFLMDYIDGDKYYKIKYPEHNLVRTRSQLKLLSSMEEQLDSMNKLISSLLEQGA